MVEEYGTYFYNLFYRIDSRIMTSTRYAKIASYIFNGMQLVKNLNVMNKEQRWLLQPKLSQIQLLKYIKMD